MFLLPLLTTTRLGLFGSVMKKHWITCLACTHGSFFAVTFTVPLLASGIHMVVKSRFSLSTLLAIGHGTSSRCTFQSTQAPRSLLAFCRIFQVRHRRSWIPSSPLSFDNYFF